MIDADTGVKWLHISDLHFKSGDPYDRDVVLKSLLESLPKLFLRFGAPDLIFVTGDIAFSGKEAEYREATKFFEHLIRISGIQKNRIFLVPGNHDVNRDGGKFLCRTLNDSEQSSDYFSEHSPSPHLGGKFGVFSHWYNSFFDGIRAFSLEKSYAVEHICVKGSEISICLFNTALFCLDEHDHGKLFLGARVVDAASSELENAGKRLKIALVHHPLDWLSEVEKTRVTAKLRASFDLILRGHLHENDIDSVNGVTGAVHMFAAGACYQGEKWPNSALFCTLKNGRVSVSPIQYGSSPSPVWTLNTSLFPNEPDYQGSYQLYPEVVIGHEETKQVPIVSQKKIVPSFLEASLVSAERDLNQHLFFARTGHEIFTPPRLMRKPQDASFAPIREEEKIRLDEIVNSSESYIIECRTEYGGSTICRALLVQILKNGDTAFLLDATKLPNYQRKLAVVLGPQITDSSTKPTLILDNFDADEHERLLNELSSSGWLSRVILVARNKLASGKLGTDLSARPFDLQPLFLWTLGRGEIRDIASKVLEPNDLISCDRAVTKVYNDLLSLRIPLTPSNVLMYLKVLQREGDFEPLNRVDILDRYLAESLRKPSDIAIDSFSFKNKMDILSVFAAGLHKEKKSVFDKHYWFAFCQNYQVERLLDFDAARFLDELSSSRIFIEHFGVIYFRYNFYFSFFLGRYLWPRSADLLDFFTSDDCLIDVSVVDVVTGLASDNQQTVTTLLARLNHNLDAFATKYIPTGFDPLSTASWPSHEDEDEKLWTPIREVIEEGPATNGEIDVLKTSLLSEALTQDQRIVFEKFTSLEYAIFSELRMLEDALKNADDISGKLKSDAWAAILRTRLMMLQLGTMLSPILSVKPFFSWGGVLFHGFNQGHGDSGSESDRSSAASERLANTIVDLAIAIITKTARDNSSIKLSSVFRSASQDNSLNGFLEVANFACIAASRGKDFSSTLKNIIERTNKTAFYLSIMLEVLLGNLRHEVMTGRDRQEMKALVALIQAKREHGKQNPSTKLVTRILGRLEKTNYFSEPADD